MRMQDFGFENAEWAGIENFKKVLTDSVFWDSVVNTLWMGTSTLISQVLALIIAYFLSKPIPRQKSVQNDLLYSLRLLGGRGDVDVEIYVQHQFRHHQSDARKNGDNAIDWLGDSDFFTWAVIIMSVWSGMGYGIILYTAALTGVNQSMVEAAKIDGAGAFRTFWNVVLPSISPTSFYLLIMGIIGALQSFAVTNVLAA